MLNSKGCTENFIRKVCEVYHVDERYFRGEIGLDEALAEAKLPGFDPAAVGERIRERRTELGLSMRKLAEMAGCSHKTIGNMEKGQGITDKTLSKIAAAMEVSTEYLKTGKQADPVSEKMIQYLNQNETLRKVILGMMREEGF